MMVMKWHQTKTKSGPLPIGRATSRPRIENDKLWIKVIPQSRLDNEFPLVFMYVGITHEEIRNLGYIFLSFFL